MKSERYEKLVALPEVGPGGARRLAEASACVVGLGGLGCAVSLYLASAGIGELALVDPDCVRESDLGRQVLYGPREVGRRKVDAAIERLTTVNPFLRLRPFAEELTRDNIFTVVEGVQVIVDCTDALPPRLLMNSACLQLGVPVVFAGAIGWNGYVMTAARDGPCFRCVWDLDLAPKTTCSEQGVFGPLVGAIGCMQAAEAMRLILGLENLAGRLQLVDFLRGNMRVLTTRRRSTCPSCGRAFT